MLARCLSASLHGLEAKTVTVEVGLPDKAIQESRERVRSALRNSGFRGPLVRPFRGGSRSLMAMQQGGPHHRRPERPRHGADGGDRRREWLPLH